MSKRMRRDEFRHGCGLRRTEAVCVALRLLENDGYQGSCIKRSNEFSRPSHDDRKTSGLPLAGSGRGARTWREMKSPLSPCP